MDEIMRSEREIPSCIDFFEIKMVYRSKENSFKDALCISGCLSKPYLSDFIEIKVMFNFDLYGDRTFRPKVSQTSLIKNTFFFITLIK
jgi:hypothetical protein